MVFTLVQTITFSRSWVGFEGGGGEGGADVGLPLCHRYAAQAEVSQNLDYMFAFTFPHVVEFEGGLEGRAALG
jgi:hypothetical protein